MRRPRRRKKPLDGVLLGMALQLGGELNVASLVQVALTRFVELVGATRAALVFVDEHGQPLRAVTHGMSWPALGEPLPLSVGMVQRVFRSGKIEMVGDATTQPEWANRGSVERLRLRLLVGVPITEHGRVTAVLYGDATTRNKDAKGPRTDLLDAMGRLVSTGLSNARMYDQRQRDVAMLSLVVEELRTPLVRVISEVDQISRAVPHSSQLEHIGTDIERAAERLAHTVDTALELARLGARGVEVPAPVCLATVLMQASEYWPASFRKHEISFEVSAARSVWVVSHPLGLEVLFVRVLSMLLDHVPSAGALVATIRQVPGGGQVVFPVAAGIQVGSVASGIAAKLGCLLEVEGRELRLFVPKDARIEATSAAAPRMTGVT